MDRGVVGFEAEDDEGVFFAAGDTGVVVFEGGEIGVVGFEEGDVGEGKSVFMVSGLSTLVALDLLLSTGLAVCALSTGSLGEGFSRAEQLLSLIG